MTAAKPTAAPAPALAPANTVLGQIERQTNDARVRMAMGLGALLEGGSLGAGPFPTGDHGQSPGPFQIRLYDDTGAPVHGNQISRAQALDPKSAVAFMLASYTNASHQVSDTLWRTNPERAAEQTAFLAERPAQDYYATAGAGTIATKFGQVQSGLAGAPLSASAGPSTSTGAGGGGAFNAQPALSLSDLNPGSWAKSIGDGISAGVGELIKPLAGFVENAFLVLAGVAIVVIGLVLVAREAGASTPSSSPSSPSSPVPATAKTERKTAEQDAVDDAPEAAAA